MFHLTNMINFKILLLLALINAIESLDELKAVQIVSDKLTQLTGSKDVVENIKVLTEIGFNAPKSEKVELLVRQLGNFRLSDEDYDCRQMYLHLSIFKSTLEKYLGSKEKLKSLKNWRIVQVYDDLQARYVENCRQEFASICSGLDDHYKPKDSTSWAISLILTKCPSECMGLLNCFSSRQSNEEHDIRKDIRSLQCVLTNKDRILRALKRNSSEWLRQRFIVRLFENHLSQFAEYNENKDNRAKVVEIFQERLREPCRRLIHLKPLDESMSQLKDILDLVDDKVNFLSVLPENNDCIPSIGYYLTCEMLIHRRFFWAWESYMAVKH